MKEFMNSTILKISLIGFASLTVSCSVKKQTIQNQDNSKAHFNQIVTPSLNANAQSSNANTVETKT